MQLLVKTIEPALHKVPGIIYNNSPTSGEVKDDELMDLYYSRMQEEYALRSHIHSKDMPKTFCKTMKAYCFLSRHSKFKIKFPVAVQSLQQSTPVQFAKAMPQVHTSLIILRKHLHLYFLSGSVAVPRNHVINGYIPSTRKNDFENITPSSESCGLSHHGCH